MYDVSTQGVADERMISVHYHYNVLCCEVLELCWPRFVFLFAGKVFKNCPTGVASTRPSGTVCLNHPAPPPRCGRFVCQTTCLKSCLSQHSGTTARMQRHLHFHVLPALGEGRHWSRAIGGCMTSKWSPVTSSLRRVGQITPAQRLSRRSFFKQSSFRCGLLDLFAPDAGLPVWWVWIR